MTLSAYELLTHHFQEMYHLQHCQAMMMWDEAVIMPGGGGRARGSALTSLSGILHDKATDPRLAELLATAKNDDSLSRWQKANRLWMQKQYDDNTCLPRDLVQAKTNAAIRCEQAWREMRANNDWQGFMPLLQEVFNTVREAAQIRGEKSNRTAYNVLLDDYNPGMSEATLDPIFNTLKDFLPDFINKVQANQATPTPITGHFPEALQKQLGEQLMQAIGFDFNQGRLDVSHHPFCGGVPEDVRITTRYSDDEFISSAMAICHETGHAMYELGLPREWLDQPVGAALGYAMHESQSLLIEMQACRSREFMHYMSKQLSSVFPDASHCDADNLYAHYTHVAKGHIRIDADEVTYPLHVIMRYEMERDLFNNTITVSDLPEVWHQSMQAYFGLSTKNNFKDGVMQDVHWPSGAFGYFPAYTLGALIAAQLFDAATAQHPTILEQLADGNFQTLFSWLRSNVHQKASSIPMQQLLTEATGSELNPQFFIRHLQKRYANG